MTSLPKIPREDFEAWAPEIIGAQVHINHTNCPEGEDTRQRLYIKRQSEKTIIAYCHNCGRSGYIHDKAAVSNVYSYTSTRTPLLGKYDSKYLTEQVWNKGISCYTSSLLSKYIAPFQLEALIEGHVSSMNIPRLYQSLASDKSWLLFPIHSFQLPTGYILNAIHYRLDSTMEKEMYEAVIPEGLDYFAYMPNIYVGGERVLLVEDPISALLLTEVCRDLGIRVMALLGTKLDEKTLSYILESGAKEVIVMMDEDEAGRKAGTELLQQLSLFTKARSVSSLEKSPKDVSSKHGYDEFCRIMKDNIGV